MPHNRDSSSNRRNSSSGGGSSSSSNSSLDLIIFIVNSASKIYADPLHGGSAHRNPHPTNYCVGFEVRTFRHQYIRDLE